MNVAFKKPFEKPDGKVTEAVAVVVARVPVSGVDWIVWSGPFSEKMVSVTTVPSGTFLPSMITGIAVFEFTVTSGTTKAPVGDVATGFPPMLTTRRVGIPVEVRKRPKGVAVYSGPVALIPLI